MNKPNISNPIRKLLWEKLKDKSIIQLVEIKELIELKTKDKRCLPCKYTLSKYKVTLEFIKLIKDIRFAEQSILKLY